jgi:multidrug efflux pump subunit AcrA (membrane-fusion protein)
MTEYVVKLGFWLRAYEDLTVEASSDEEAIEKAKAAATVAVQSAEQPDYIDTCERREGVIVYIDNVMPDGNRRPVAEDVAFDDDRIHPKPA